MSLLSTPLETVEHDSDIPVLRLGSDMERCWESVSPDIAQARSVLPYNRRTRSGSIVQPVNLGNHELDEQYPAQNQNQFQALKTSLRKDGVINWRYNVE